MKYYIREKVFSFGDKFTIKNEQGQDMYWVQGKVFSIGNKLKIYDNSDREVVYIEQALFKFLPEYNIYYGDNMIGKVKKQFTFFSKKFDIWSSLGDYSIEGDFFAHDFDIIKHGVGRIATITKGWFTFGDCYEIDVAEGENHPFILSLVIIIDQVLHEDRGNHNNT